jgi:hypothetical protein
MPTSSPAAPFAAPIRNMRLCFWGVQGSCPLFPESSEVDEYKRMISMDLLQRLLADMQAKSFANGGSVNVEDLLGGPVSDSALDGYLKKLGVSTLPVYGGDTTCISIETADGNILVFDGGSGIRNCSKHVVNGWLAGRPREIHIFGSHEHLDHRSGLPFSQFCYVRPPFTLNIHGGYRFLSALDERYGLFSRKLSATTHLDDPIDYRVLSASFKGIELRHPKLDDGWNGGEDFPRAIRDVNEPIVVGNTQIRAFDVYHGGTRCLAYKVTHGPSSFVFCTDHELRRGNDPTDPREAESHAAEDRITEFCHGVDVAYFDGQYFLEEYLGRKGIGVTPAVSRVDWGHGCIEDVIDRSRRCGVRRTIIGHHDPERSWPERLRVDRWLQSECAGQPYTVELAQAESVIDL